MCLPSDFIRGMLWEAYLSLLSLLENIDSEYISIEELLNEIQQILGENKTRDDAIVVLIEMLRREREFPIPVMQYKDLVKGWGLQLPAKVVPFNHRYTQSLNLLQYLEVTETDSDDLPF